MFTNCILCARSLQYTTLELSSVDRCASLELMQLMALRPPSILVTRGSSPVPKRALHNLFTPSAHDPVDLGLSSGLNSVVVSVSELRGIGLNVDPILRVPCFVVKVTSGA